MINAREIHRKIVAVAKTRTEVEGQTMKIEEGQGDKDSSVSFRSCYLLPREGERE